MLHVYYEKFEKAAVKPIELTVPMDFNGQLCGRTLAFRITNIASPTDMA